MSLVSYLASLNTSENQWSLWVNPSDVDDYRIGQDIFENGGLSDDKVCIGSLESLSFGFQSTTEAIEQYLKDCNGVIQYDDRPVKVNIPGILNAYSNGSLDSTFASDLEANAESIKEVWANLAAENKVEELRIYFAPGGEWEMERAQASIEAQAWQDECDRQQQEYKAGYADA